MTTNHKGIKVLSLFDGISIGRLALENLGIKVDRYDAYEIDGPAIAISRYHFDDIVRHGDVRDLNLDDYDGYDLVCFGSPCQDFSQLNAIRRGLDGAKSSLFYYGAMCVQSGKFKHFLCENVRMSPKCRDEINKCLGTEAVMYDSVEQAASHRPRNYWTDVPWTAMPKAYDIDSIIEDGWFAGAEATGTLTTKAEWQEERCYRRMISTWNTNVVFRENPNGIYLHGSNQALINYYPRLKLGQRYDIRGLRPTEMELLMNMPRDYTKYSKRTYKLKGDVISETGMYSRVHAIGNSWTVTVIEDIFRAMFLR